MNFSKISRSSFFKNCFGSLDGKWRSRERGCKKEEKHDNEQKRGHWAKCVMLRKKERSFICLLCTLHRLGRTLWMDTHKSTNTQLLKSNTLKSLMVCSMKKESQFSFSLCAKKIFCKIISANFYLKFEKST